MADNNKLRNYIKLYVQVLGTIKLLPKVQEPRVQSGYSVSTPLLSKKRIVVI